MSSESKDFILLSNLPDSIKSAYRVDACLKEKHQLYLHLISYISPLFPAICQKDLFQIESASYLYFRFLLEVDSLLDKKDSLSDQSTFRRVSMAFEVYEESIKILSSVFCISSPFWEKFRSFKLEYCKAIFLEKEYSKSRAPFTEQTFEQLAEAKSAICYTAISALSELNGPISNEDILEKTLRHIHIALQYIDDIDDLEEDIKENQWTFTRQQVEEYVRNKNNKDSLSLRKYLFISGIAGSLIDKALGHLEIASAFSIQLGLTELNIFLEKHKNSVVTFKNEIGQLLLKTLKKVSKSQNISSVLPITEAILAGQNFVTSNLQNGLWADFMTSAGEGEYWISSFVGMLFYDLDYPKQILDTVLILMEKGAFNDQMIDDADSIGFMVGFHWRLNNSVPQNLINDWLKFSNCDGSFSTYCDEKRLREVLNLSENISTAGWISPHACVTAAAAYILSDIPFLKKEYDLSIGYLLSRFNSEQGIKAYWWTNDLYAQSFALLALSKAETCERECIMLNDCIIAQQHKEGYWENPWDSSPSPFYTALAVKALLNFQSALHVDKIRLAVDWLLANQTTDGSWFASRILRIPATDVVNPQLVFKWRVSSFGVNTLVDDHNRIFSTAMIVNTLHTYFISQKKQ